METKIWLNSFLKTSKEIFSVNVHVQIMICLYYHNKHHSTRKTFWLNEKKFKKLFLKMLEEWS